MGIGALIFMRKNQIRATRLAALCLGSSIFALSPAMASSFSVGGGTITTTANDGSGDLTGTGGPFILAPNGGGTADDVITITGVSITNIDNSVTGRAIDVGGLNPSTSSYSVVAHGNTLQGSDNAGLWVGNNGGTVSFDSTGGAANHVSGSLGIMVVNTAAGGNVSIRTGADIITTTGAFAGEVLNGSANGTGTVSIDSAGATLTGGGSYGIVAQAGSGAITIGGLNGGIASSINVANGDGIHASSSSSIIHVTLANAGSITARNGIWLQGDTETVDSFGTIIATNDAINASFAGPLLVTLEQGSTTSGRILASSADDVIKLVTGANIGGASFDGGGGTNLINLLGSGIGTLDVSTAANFSTIQKDGSGTWTLTRSGAAGISGTSIALNAGTLIADSGSLSGNVASIAGSVLQFSQTVTGTYAGVISGGGSVVKAGGGLLTLSNSNSYTGGTTVSAGALKLGVQDALPNGGDLIVNGGVVDLNGTIQAVGTLSGAGGSIALNGIPGAAQPCQQVACLVPIGSSLLTINSAVNSTLFSLISGSGNLIKAGSGTLNLVATNTYTGWTEVSAGKLNVTGSIAASHIFVDSGASLSGTGTVGAVTVASGGTLSPSVGTPGTLTVSGNLTLAPGSTYIDNFDPDSASLTAVSGSASINGSLVANAAPGTYSIGKRYTLLTAAGGVNGTFSSFTAPGLPGAFRSTLSYDANDVFLTLSPNALSPLLPANATFNQRALAGGIDAALAGGATLPGGFAALFNLSGQALGGALNQLTGEIGNDASRSAAQALSPFLTLLMRTRNGNGDSLSAATSAPADVKPAQLQTGAVRVWGAAYGGHSRFGADAITGEQQLSTGATGMAIGIESQVTDEFLIGGSIAGAGETFSLAGEMSQGISSDLMAGIYARTTLLNHGYLTGALVYGAHNVGTERAITISGTDVLKGKFVADDFGGRLEGGYGFDLEDGFDLTPYAALAGENFSAPAYDETALSGTSTFALSHAAKDTGLVHSELGTRLGHDFGLASDALFVELHAAWAHQIQDDVISQASFGSLTGSSFAVAGAAWPMDSGLLGLGLSVASPAGVSAQAKAEAQFGGRFTAVSGSLSIGYSW
ncbi:MAG: autotransporter domain-containing protein [Alphaproteobacteria bacterium]|nr:autotransporter domain-containing protein [Alphaproteobacteria bacterium]